MAKKKFSFEGQEFCVSYEIVGEQNSDDLLILHGWGAKKELMKIAFSNKFSKFRQIYVDLPGFGGSNLNKAMNSANFARVLAEFLRLGNFSPNVILGHSFGGKIAVLLNPKILILLSSAGILTPKKLNIRLKIAVFKALKFCGLGRFYRFFASKDANKMDATMYETFKMVVDENFAEIFAKFSGFALIFWGEKDTATPLSSGEKIHKLIKNSKFYPLKGDHFFFLKNAEFIDAKVSEFVGEFGTKEIIASD